MKTPTLRILALTAALLGFLNAPLQAQVPQPEAPPLGDVLRLKGGKSVVFQPIQLKRDQTLLVSHTAFTKTFSKPGTQLGALLVVYSTSPGEENKVLFQDFHVFPEAGTGAGPHVKVFDGYSPEVTEGTQGIIAVLIGLLLPANGGEPRAVQLPSQDGISAEIHDSNALIGLLLPAVQKVREAAR